VSVPGRRRASFGRQHAQRAQLAGGARVGEFGLAQGDDPGLRQRGRDRQPIGSAAAGKKTGGLDQIARIIFARVGREAPLQVDVRDERVEIVRESRSLNTAGDEGAAGRHWLPSCGR